LRRSTAAVAALLLGACAMIDEPEPGTPGQGLVREGPSRLVLGAGVFDAYQESTPRAEAGRTGVIQADLRHGRRVFGLGPAAGAMLNGDGGIATFAGLYADFSVGYLMITPLLGAGAWFKNDAKDLGGTFMLRTEVDIAYVRKDGIRFGLRWGHLSNAYVYNENPSQEDFMFTVGAPF
jgi:lipid A 3-O-deacylase